MCKQLKGQKGFTLIELMIVVAIIGILAAIAIPNFLTYQMKSRQSEAKTNLQAIKTSEVSFQAERGCYIGLTPFGVVVPAPAVKTIPFTWGAGPAASPPATVWCTVTTTGVLTDIGFVATGNVNYLYAVNATQLAPPLTYTTAVSCPVAIASPAGLGPLIQNNFVAAAQSNLDGDNAGVTTGVSTWNSTVDHGANDCTTGQY